jgi:uncharacterized phage protein (TIGR01671 family)
MREILFRGKQADGMWVYGDLRKVEENAYILDYDIGDDGVSQNPKIFDIAYPVDPATVGQHTGLTDKNGKRVFEGDILNIGKSKEPLIVSFVDFAWQCSTPKHKYFRHRLENCASYKIIGNIHDNPELLP